MDYIRYKFVVKGKKIKVLQHFNITLDNIDII